MISWTVVALVLITAFANLVGGLIVVRKKWSSRSLNYLMAFSAGFLLTIAILDLIPEGLDDASGNAVFILLGFLTVFAFQRILTTHFHFGYETHKEKLSQKTAGLGAFLGMGIHSFFDGVSIVAGFEVAFRFARCNCILFCVLADRNRRVSINYKRLPSFIVYDF